MFTKDDKRINRNGRPKGTTNKNALELKQILTQMLQGYLDELNTQSDQLTLRDKLNFSRYVPKPTTHNLHLLKLISKIYLG